MDNIKTNSEVGNLIRQQEQDYTSGNPVRVSEYVEVDTYADLNRIDAYANSKHISGDTDSKGREKPFFDIVTAVMNIWYRATDIDRKNIRIYSNKKANYVSSFIATIYLQNWMNKARFGSFLNKWGRTLSKYGSAVLKFVEKDGELIPSVVNWHTLIVDPVDFAGNPVIEVLDLTPAQLRKRGYDEEAVEKLIEDTESGKRDVRRDLKGIAKDERDGYIRVYEVHGELEEEYLTDNEEDEGTAQMMIAFSFTGTESKGYTDYFLYRGREKNPYMLTHLIEEDGQTLSKGAVKTMFESQWMVNHSMKAVKDQLDLASKLIFQTADENYVGKNALSAIEQGDILVHAMNAPLTQVANNSHDITSLQNQKTEWQSIANEQAGASDAMRGVAPKAGTAWRQTEAMLQENHSLFEIMTENKGLAIEDMLRDFVLPFLRRKLNNKDEIVAVLESYDLQRLDKTFIKAKARQIFEKKAKDEIKQSLLKGEVPNFIDPDTQDLEQKLQKDLADFGNERFIVPSEIDDKTWKDVFKDLEWEVEVDVTGEAKDLQAHLQTLNTLYINMLNSGQVQDARKVLEKILEITGAFSPIELATLEPVVPQAQEVIAPAEAPAEAR